MDDNESDRERNAPGREREGDGGTDEEYDVVVLGGGSGSQVATAAAERGLEAAVLEPGPLGGACITRGCVPSKALIQRAELIETIQRAGQFGIDAEVRGVEYGSITETIRETVYEKADRQREALERAERVTFYDGAGRFVDDRVVEVDGGDDAGARVRGEQVVIAVGSRPTEPPIEGLEEVEYLTSDDALYLDARPDSLVIVGGGYIAAELGWFFAAMGTDVSIVGRSDALVPREDADASEAVTAALEERCELYLGHEATAVSERDGGVAVTVEADDEEAELSADEVLVAAGRQPNTDTLALENTGVETDERGHVEVDEFLETAVSGVWAIGDVLAEFPFKHVADYETEVVSANVFGDADRGREPVEYTAIPHAIFTSPQVASVGQTEAELEDGGIDYDSTLVSYDAAPRGLILEEPESFVKVLAGADGEILGCHIVGSQASTMIHEVVVAMRQGSGTVNDVAGTVHVHPALNEVVVKAFDELSDRPYSTAPDWRDVAPE